MWCPAARDDFFNMKRSSLQGYNTYLARTDVFSAAQAEDLVEGQGKSGPTEACCSAVIDGPHESQRPGAHQFHEEEPGCQRQAIPHRALWALGILQQRFNQDSLPTWSDRKERVRKEGKHREKNKDRIKTSRNRKYFIYNLIKSGQNKIWQNAFLSNIFARLDK